MHILQMSLVLIGEKETRDSQLKRQKTSGKYASDHSSRYHRHKRSRDSSQSSSSCSRGYSQEIYSAEEPLDPSHNELQNNSPERTAALVPASSQNEVITTQGDNLLENVPEERSNLAENQTKDAFTMLDPEVLEAIGKRLDTNIQKGPPIHDDIFVRWNDIMKEGLPKEEIKELFKKYGIPENCSLVEPPKLNPEIKASLSEPLTKRDEKMIEK